MVSLPEIKPTVSGDCDVLKILVISAALLAPTTTLLAFDATVKGFIALDMLVLKKEESRDSEVETGIGTIDLKVYATHDDFSAKIKLDLDDSSIGDAYNIFEEATVSYKFMPDHQLLMGKGKVPFHQMHWGVVSSSFIDGGAELTPDHSLYDLDNRLLLSWRYGGFTRGFFNYLTYFGTSQSVSKDSGGEPYVTRSTRNGLTRYSLSYRNEKTFSSKDEVGVANQFEWFFNRQLSAQVAGMYYYNDINPKNSWAFDLATTYSSRELEVWAEYVTAFTSTHYAAKYATERKYEHLFQLGAEYYLTELYNVLANAEAAFVNNQHHAAQPGDVGEFNDGKRVHTQTFKLEAGIKIKLQKSAYVTVGAQAERQDQQIKADDIDTTKHAFMLKSGFSFWF